MPWLVMLSGLPGSGKSTLAKALASRTGAELLRIDVYEQDLRNAHGPDFDVGTQGYEKGYSLADKFLTEGRSVIADAVNAVEAARNGWRSIAQRTGAELVEIEITCSSIEEISKRLESRDTGIVGLHKVKLEDRQRRLWEANPFSSGRIDTAGRGVEDCVTDIMRLLERI